jgi:hypothetical protein
MGMTFADLVVRAVAELPDRTSPDDQPELLMVTDAELRSIINREVRATFGQEAPNAARYRWLRSFSGHRLKVVDRAHDAEYYESALDAAIDREMMGDCDVPSEDGSPK